MSRRMIQSLTLALFVLSFLSVGFAQQTGKIGVINSQVVLEKSVEGKRVITQLQNRDQGAVRQLQELQAQLFNRVQAELIPIIEGLGQEKDVDVIFDLAKSGAVYFNPVIDLTDEVIRRYDASKAAQSSALPSREQTGALEKSSGAQTSKPAWHNHAVWDRVIDGMSESQVVAILGEPTSVEGGGTRTLFYHGEVPGSGVVSGNVKLMDDRVWLVNKPVF